MKIMLMLAILSGVFMDDPKIEGPVAEDFQCMAEWLFEEIE